MAIFPAPIQASMYVKDKMIRVWQEWFRTFKAALELTDFTNANHNHSTTVQGGNLTLAAIPTITATVAQVNQLTVGYSGTFQVVSDMRNNAGTHEKKTRNLTFTNGVLTTLGAESAWTVI